MKNPFDPGYFHSEELRSFGFAHVGENVRIAKNCVIIGLENIEIGDDVRVDCNTRIIAAGGFLRVGDFVHIHTGCLLGCRGGVTLENYSTISHDCRLITATDDMGGAYMVGGVVPSEATSPTIAPIVMKAHSGIAMNSSVLPGVTIGEGTIAFLHTLVNRDLEPWSLYAGSPARRLRARERGVLGFQAEIEGIQAAA